MPIARYRSLSGAWVDAEKARDNHDYDYDSDTAPSLTAESHPMLSQHSPPPKKYALRYHLPRRRFSRYFTLLLTSLLFLLAFYLVKSSWSSEAQVRMGLRKSPPPPPAWEQFPFLKRYHGGIRTLVSRKDNVPEYPNAEKDEEDVERLKAAALEQKQKEDRIKGIDNPSGFGKREEGSKIPTGIRFDPYSEDDGVYEPRVHCYLDNKTKTEIPQIMAHEGIPKGFPDPVMGSYDLFGLRNDVCFERFGRLGPYGFGYSRKYGGSGAGMEGEQDGSEQVWGDQMEVNYKTTKWADVQQACMDANSHRFKSDSNTLNHFFQSMGSGGPRKDSADSAARKEKTTGRTGKKLKPRTAVIIRTWKDYDYDHEDLLYLRALVNELTIQSGTEYVVHFLIHVKDNDLQIWADEDVYNQALAEALPEEFRGMGTLWSEKQMEVIYGGMHESNYRDRTVHGAYRSTYMPMQYFAHMHPEYDFFWHWEMDIRYTGHFYHLFDKVSSWAKEQPRKGLWERNGRFYVPSEHGSWEDFKQMVRIHTEHGTATNKQALYEKIAADAGATNPLDPDSRKPMKSIWGPLRPENDEVVDPDADPIPPTTYDKDAYEWGVGEEADFITFNPLFDPHNTNWILAEDVTGYNTSQGFPPRRTAIITASRLSRRLLETMHRETTHKRRTMFSEMWPGSCALQHGLKAVYAPHPVYIDRRWPTGYLAAIFNNGLHGAAGGSRTSVFSDERQHNFLGTTWYYHAGFGPNLWKRWLGYKVDGDGGEQEEKAREGRICLPGMMIHPVKQVDLIYEHRQDEQ